MVGDVVGQGQFDQTDAFFGDQGMSSEAPEEDEVLFFAADHLTGIVTQGSLGIAFGSFGFVL